MRRSVLVAVLCVLLIGLGLHAPAGAVASQVTVTRLSGVPTSGIQYVVRVGVPNGLVGQKVWLERKVAKKWKPLKKATLTSTKKVTLYAGLWLGAQTIRVHVFRKGNRKAAYRVATVVARPRLEPTLPGPYLGEIVSITAQLPTSAGRMVTLQRRTAGTWENVGAKNFTGNPRFTRSVTGIAEYRLVVAKQGNLPAIVSPATLKIVPQDRTQLISRTPSGAHGNGESEQTDVSGDGRFVVFQSRALDLGPTDANGFPDIYLRDRWSKTTTLVSHGINGQVSNGDSTDPVISYDGRFIAYSSESTKLIASDGNGAVDDIFVYDRTTGANRLVSHDKNGGPANGDSSRPTISADGDRIAFSSGAQNLSTETDSNSVGDVYLWARSTDKLSRISKPANNSASGGGGANPTISADGRFIAFVSTQADIVSGSSATASNNAFLRNVGAGTTTLVSSWSCPGGGFNQVSAVSNSGSVALYSNCTNVIAGDGNGAYDVFVKNTSGGVALVSHAFAGGVGNASSFGELDMTSSGRWVAFTSSANNLVDGGSTVDGNSAKDVFTWNSITGVIRLVSVRADGHSASGDSELGAISDDGNAVTWVSAADNILPSDANTDQDVYIRDFRGQ